MKQYLTIFTLHAVILALSAQNDNSPEWEDPRVFAINKERTRTSCLPYPDEKLAFADNYADSPYYRSLNGDWDFLWLPRTDDIPKGFYEENYYTAGWTTLPVPANWELNGFGIPMYVNNGFGFPSHPPYVDREDSPTGLYRCYFDVPEAWDGRRVFLHFEAGTNAMYVWINGTQAGYTENAKSPAEFDITPYIREGKNLLACQVHKFSDGSYLEDQDMWRLGGINRNVYLYSAAQTRILDFFVQTDLDATYKNAAFAADVLLKNYTSSEKNRRLEIKILNDKGKAIFAQEKRLSIPPNGTTEVPFTAIIPSPAKWTAETPHLYTLLISLKDGQKKLIEATSHKIGFRKVEIKNGQLLVNGKKIYLKGVNLHEFNHKTGQVLDTASMLQTIRLMKELNINAVRTSHYPQPPYWNKLCDRYGLYLVDEANLESHGLGFGADNVSNFPEWRDAHIDRVVRLVERDKNHPSVICWSLGNEAGNGKAFFDMYDWAKARDKTRPVQYEQAGRERNTDIICPMYPFWEEMRRVSESTLTRPYILCEYAHAMGNSMGNFQEYWDLIRRSNNMQGGFIWEWHSHGFKTKDEQGRAYWAYGGDLKGYGKMNKGNFCIDGIVSPDQEYMPHSHIVKKVYQNVLFEAKDLNEGIVAVINDYTFTDITPGTHVFKWRLIKNGEEMASDTFFLSIPAGTKKDVKLNLPETPSEEGVEYFLQFLVYTKKKDGLIPEGFEIAKEEFEMPGGNFFVNKGSDIPIVRQSKSDDRIEVEAGGSVYVFSIADGKTWISVADDKGKKRCDKLPGLNFWRAPTDNDIGAWAHYQLRLWESAAHNIICRYEGVEETDNAIVFHYELKPRGVEAIVRMSYRVNGNGSLDVNLHYKALSDELPELPRFGMIWELPEAYNNVSWYGRGPHENYIDRRADAWMGVWNKKTSEMAYPYVRPQETGNRCDVRWIKLENGSGKGWKIIGAQPLSVNAIHYRPEDFDPGLTKKQQHTSDLLPRKEVVLYIDLFQRGLGGLDSWGANPLDSYRFKAKEYSYGYTIHWLK